MRDILYTRALSPVRFWILIAVAVHAHSHSMRRTAGFYLVRIFSHQGAQLPILPIIFNGPSNLRPDKASTFIISKIINVQKRVEISDKSLVYCLTQSVPLKLWSTHCIWHHRGFSLELCHSHQHQTVKDGGNTEILQHSPLLCCDI